MAIADFGAGVQAVLRQRMLDDLRRQQIEAEIAEGQGRLQQGERGLGLRERELQFDMDQASQPVPEKPMAVGGRLVMPSTGEVRFEPPPEPVKPERPMALSPGAQLVDPTTGRLIASAPDRPPAPKEPKDIDYEWVLRGGNPTKVPKNQPAIPGDSPYRAPQSTTETAQDRQRSARIDAARGFLGKLNELRTKINVNMGPKAGLTGLVRQGKAAIGMDPDVAEYERERSAAGRALAVAIMGAQNLSDADAKAWADMLPGARVDEETAQRLMTQVGTMLESMAGDMKIPGAPSAGGAAPANNDPLGLRR